MRENQLATKKQIFIVEDENISEAIKDCLENLGYDVPDIASSGEEAITKITAIRPDLVLMDISLKGNIDGVQAGERIWNYLQIPVVYCTGHSDTNTLERAKLTEPFGYLLKPFEQKNLYVTIETALQRHKLEMQLKEKENWLETIIKSIGDAIIVTDPKSCIKFFNPVAEALTGWKQEDALNRNLQEVFNIINVETLSPLANAVTEVLNKGVIIYSSEQINLVSKNGTKLTIANSTAPLKNHNGEITGAVIVFRNSDIKNSRQVEHNFILLQAQQLEIQKVELQRQNQLKDEFISTVAHELRAPIANIKMAIQMLQLVLDRHGVFSPESNSESIQTTRYFQILHDQCEQELNLINDLLDLQRLDADVHNLELTTILLQHWLPNVVEGFAEHIRHNKQNICVNICPNLPPLVSDLPSLKRILTELLNNACKYTPPGEQITITVDAHPNIIQLQVSNSGVEIPVDKLCRVFEKFYRIPSSNLSKQSGTGLGLALVKKLVEQLNGEIVVTSDNNQTTFTLKFPLR
ncbi:MAG: response regulator [Gloeocapsa sp. UFS-A4-WI-NPMV-4B04]|jgi:hypothetical protein|nr:response regulator [Gloeocapsa sp. UFS-A4-WI-NPMV-4B04]